MCAPHELYYTSLSVVNVCTVAPSSNKETSHCFPGPAAAAAASVVVGGTSHPRSQRSVRSVGRHPRKGSPIPGSVSQSFQYIILICAWSAATLQGLPSLRRPVRCEGLGTLALDSSPGPVGDAPAAPVPLGRAPYSHGAVVRGRSEHVRIHRVPSDAVDGSAEEKSNFCHRSRYDETKTMAIVPGDKMNCSLRLRT